MRIAFVKYFYEKHPSISVLLEKYFTSSDWGEALVDSGCTVHIIQRYSKDKSFTKNGVNYHFINIGTPGYSKNPSTLLSFIRRVMNLLNQEEIEVIQLDDLSALMSNMVFSRAFNHIPIVVQDHGSVLRHANFLKRFIRKLVYKFSLKKVEGVLFAAEGLEKEWVRQSIIPSNKCFIVMENSSDFRIADRGISREKTQMTGTPVFLWVGNLNQNKDPFTVIKAFSKIVNHFPEAKLYMIFRFDDLKIEVEELIKTCSLQNQIVLLGSKKREELHYYYNSSDYMLAASYKEGSGYSVIEAMSCGVVPILSDIPSFRRLTGNGTVGKIFETGNAESLYGAVLEITEKPVVEQREKTLQYFQNYNSFQALAKDAMKTYRECISGRLS